MKRCPECRRDYYDDSLVYCLDDGKELLYGRSPAHQFEEPGVESADEPATAILPSKVSKKIHDSEMSSTSDPARPMPPNIVLSRKFLMTGVLGVLLVAGIGIGAYWLYGGRTSKQIDSIAVMPFINESGNADIDYLSDGMTESLINTLTQVPNLTVKPRSSAFRYKGRESEAKVIGSELSVGAILNGRLVQKGDEITLFLSLIDTKSENQIWGRQYTRKLANLITLQTEIVRDVTESLKPKLTGVDQQKLTKNYTQNDEAYQLYLKGRFAWNRRAIPLATEFFQQAIALDPNYALAYAGLADAYASPSVYADYDPGAINERILKARDATLKALSIDNNLAEAHTALGRVLFWINYDFAGAEREYRLAIESNPSYADAHYWLAGLLSLNPGRSDEASLEFKRTLELEPLNLVYLANYGGFLSRTGRYGEAIAHLEKTLELDKDFLPTVGNLSNAYIRKGDFAKGIETRVRELELSGDHDNAVRTRDAFANGGWEGYLQFQCGSDRPKYVTFYGLAQCHAGLGEKDKAFEALNKSYENRDRSLPQMKGDPRLESLRDDPRFNKLLRRLGFSE